MKRLHVISFIVVLLLAGCTAPKPVTSTQPAATHQPQKLIRVSEQYYMDGTGKPIKVEGFRPYQADINVMILQDANPNFGQIFGVPIKLFCKEGCIGNIISQGTLAKAEAANSAVIYVAELADGAYVELRMSQPIMPECTLQGLHFEGSHLYIAYLSSDGQKYVSQWDVDEGGVTNLGTILFADQGWEYSRLVLSDGKWAAGINGRVVEIYVSQPGLAKPYAHIDVCNE